MIVRFSIDVDIEHQAQDCVLMAERDLKLRAIAQDLSDLTGRVVDFWDDAQFGRVQFTFSPATKKAAA